MSKKILASLLMAIALSCSATSYAGNHELTETELHDRWTRFDGGLVSYISTVISLDAVAALQDKTGKTLKKIRGELLFNSRKGPRASAKIQLGILVPAAVAGASVAVLGDEGLEKVSDGLSKATVSIKDALSDEPVHPGGALMKLRPDASSGRGFK